MIGILAFLTGGWNLLVAAVTAVLTAFTALPRWAKEVIVLAIFGIALYAYAHHQGAVSVQTQWDAAQANAVAHNTQVGVDIREQAEAAIPPLPPASAVPIPRPSPCRVPDAFDRDCTASGGR